MKIVLPLFGVGLALLVGTASSQTILTNANAPALTGPGVGVQTFTTTPQGNYPSLNLGAITFSGPSGVRVENLYAGQYNAIGNYLNNNNGTNSTLTLTFGAPMAAFGFNYGASDDPWTLSAYDAGNNLIASTIVAPIAGSSNGEFIGIASPTANIAYATYKDDGGMWFPDWILIDNVKYTEVPLVTNGPAVDCNCVANLPGLQTNGCPAYVPDLCALAANCFSTNMLPGSCLQNPPAGSLAGPGTNNISLMVMDTQSNMVFCQVAFVVIPPPNPKLSLTCSPAKTVSCGSGWMFDDPIVNSTCCDPLMAVSVVGNTTSGVCPQIITRTWQVTNACGLSASCSQTVTVVDTNPPVTLCSGVNLVPNGDFEYHTACPSSGGQISLAAPWFPATDGTCEYFHPCATTSYVSVPTNSVGHQVPLSGQGYAGILVYGPDVNVPGSSYREYIEVPLLTPLVAGQAYSVSFNVSRAENYAAAIAEIGACFSSGPIISNGYTGVLNFMPQVVNPSTNLLLSTTAWMLVQGTFVAAGGESYLTLGNFLADAGTTAVPASGLYTNFSYYYFDDVSVVPLCPGTVTNKTVQCDVTWTFDPPTPFDQCSGTNVTVTIASTVTNGVCPTVITRTWTLTDLCGNSTNWSQAVTIVGSTAPVVDCNCLQTNAAALLTTNACLGTVPDLCQFTNCFANTCGPANATQSPVAGTPVGPGVYPITVTVWGCSGATSNSCVLPFQVNAPAPSLSLICASNKTVECGSLWMFDAPIPVTTCCNPASTLLVLSTTTNGTCPQFVTRVWKLTDACNNSLNCTQTVAVVDTTPPATQCSGVNLVPNGQFEFYTNCPSADSQFNYAYPWFTPTAATSDYFNSCGGPNSPVSTPTNVVGVRTPLSGQGYAGAFVYGTNFGNSYREYLEVPLAAPLVAGQTYLVSFNVSRSPFYGYAVAEIGARLSSGPIVSNLYTGVLNFVPQIVNPSANVITSTTNWTLIQGAFTAVGGESYLTLGNFLPDPLTTTVFIGGFGNTASYYYFDDVSVVALCPSEVTNKTVVCGSPVVFDPPVGSDACSGTNVTVTVASTVTNGTCPRVITRTWNLTDLCGNTSTWSQSISIADPSPPVVVNCGCLQDSILPLLTTNGCSGVIPDLSLLTNSFCISGGSTNCGTVQFAQSPPAGTIVGPGVHPVTVSFLRCLGASNGCVLPFSVYSPPPVIVCPPNLVLLTCAASAIGNFAPTAYGNVGPVVCSPPSGSSFSLGGTTVTCTATNACGGTSSCSFTVTVRPPSTRWSCYIIAIGIAITPIGNSSVTYLATLPGGGLGVDFGNFGDAGQDGMRLVPGPAQKLTFSTVLDFNAPAGAAINLALPDVNGGLSTPWLSLTRSCQPQCGWDIKASKLMVDDPAATFRSIAIGTNGELFSSFTQTGANLDTSVLASLSPMGGATSALMTVTLDLRTREVTLAFPSCTWTPDTARKGWDGCIYGNGPRGSTTNKTARLILTPLTTVASPPITALDLIGTKIDHLAFDNPSITASGRKWGDGHVTLMKAYDDGTEEGLEFASFGDGGGVSADLGHAASFQFRMGHFETGDIPTEEQIFSIRGWPPGTTTNRPPPPVFDLRLAPSASGVGIDCSADFTQWGVSNVTVQLWDHNTLISEKPHVLATLASSLVTLGGFPGILGCPGVGVVSLADTNPITVLSGLDCPSTGCVGTELRILAELTPDATPPVAFMGLQCLIAEGMDELIYGLQTTPACTPVPLNAVATPEAITLSWAGDGFRLQGAETLAGPWYDLGVDSPVILPGNYPLRVFRLLCD